jgi:hypothetical protein
VSEHENTPGGGQMPPPGPDQRAWQGQGGPVPPPAAQQQAEADAEHQRTRTRIGVTIAALVATLGAVILGVVLANGHGHTSTSNAAGANPNAVVDPPSASAGASGSASGGVLPMLSGIPAAPPALSSASAMASAQAAEKAFKPPTVVPSDVRPYSAGAPLDAVVIPPFLTVSIPGIQAKDAVSQTLATQFESFLKAWVEAWAAGNVDDPRYRAWCADQCLTVTEPTITLWKNANIVPAGTLRFFEMAGGVVNGGFSAEAGVCLDDSQRTAFRDGVSYQNPYPAGAPTLYVFGLVNDKAQGRWIVTEAYTSPGDSYCAATGSTS